MSTNTGNGDNNNGVDHRAAAEQSNGDPTSSQTKLIQEHLKKETAAKTPTPPPTSTGTMIINSKQTREEQAKAKQPSTHPNTDSTQGNGNKSSSTSAQQSKSVLKRFSTAIGKGLNLGNRNRLGQDNSTIDSQPRLEQGEKISEQHRATDLSQNKEGLLAAQDNALIERPEDNTKRQQDSDQHDFVDVAKEHPTLPIVSDPEKRTKEPEKMSECEMEITLLKKLITEHTMEIASLKKSVAESNGAIASLEARLGRNDPCSLTPNDKVKEIKPVLRDEMATSPIQEQPVEGLDFRKADGISVTEVADLVKALNAQIDQAASLIIDLLSSLESSSSGKDSEIAWDGLHEYLGSWLCDEFQRKSKEPEINYTVAQFALQAGLVHACSRIINDWNPPFWTDGLAFSRVYDNIAGVEGPLTADTWRALARNHMVVREDQLEANKEYLDGVLLKLITAVSGSLQSGKMLLQQCNEKVDDIAKKAIGIHGVISREARSTDLSTFTIEFGTDFDQSRMEDTDSKAGPVPPSKVGCTVEMGLRGRKRVPSRQQSGDGRVGNVTLKAKVILLATLSEL